MYEIKHYYYYNLITIVSAYTSRVLLESNFIKVFKIKINCW